MTARFATRLTLAGLAVGAHWRYAYVLGVFPALLILWVRSRVKEPETWMAAQQKSVAGLGARLGSFRDLLLNPLWGRRAILAGAYDLSGSRRDTFDLPVRRRRIRGWCGFAPGLGGELGYLGSGHSTTHLSRRRRAKKPLMQYGNRHYGRQAGKIEIVPSETHPAPVNLVEKETGLFHW